MKKAFKILVTIFLSALLCLAVVACDNTKDPTRHTVTFTGEGITTFTQTVEDGSTVIEPKDYTREGYEFVGWFRDGSDTAYVFSTPVHESFTLTAKWKKSDDPTPPKPGPVAGLDGEGTAASPYLIDCAADIEIVANHVNAGDEGYYDAYYRLEADIDLSQENFTPIGEIVADKGVYGFSGDFDGNGHTVSGIKIQRTVRSEGIFGFFGYTDMATIHDLAVEYEISVECYSASATIIVGGVVAYATNTNFENVTSKGVIETSLMAENTVYLGGLAGVLSMESVNGQGYIAFVENCSANITTTIVDEGKTEGGSLEEAVLGGLIGRISTGYVGSVAIVNSASSGTVHGGMFTGGLVGYADEYVSVIDCISQATVEPTSESVSYAGGIIGRVVGDCLIMDSISTGTIRGKQASTSSTYQSYKGGLVGYAPTDDYEIFYSAGVAIVNSYYSGRVTGTGTTTSQFDTGRQVTFSENFLYETLNWNKDCWTVDGTTVTPTNVLHRDAKSSYTVTLSSNGATVEQVSFESNNLIGEVDVLANVAPNVFWDWELAEGVGYRFYMPIVKNVTLTAKWQDVSQIAGTYTGISSWWGGTNNAGTIVVGDDGMLQWIRSSLSMGEYRFNGTNFVAEIYSSIGEISGEFVISDNSVKFVFDIEEGMSATVTYTFVKSEQNITLLGEYYSPTGDILTFAGDGTLTYQSHLINNGNYISGTYVESGNNLSFDGRISEFFGAVIAKLNEDGTITVTATAMESGGYAFSDVTFSKMGVVNYSSEGFVGNYTLTYITASSYSTAYANLQRLTLNANGTGTLATPYSQRVIRYYYFKDSGYIKYIDEGHVSTFYYDSELGIFWGKFLRGETAYSYVVIAPLSQGRVYGSSTGDRSVMLFFTETSKYVIVNGDFIRNATITGEFVDGARITIDGQAYYLSLENMNDYNEYCTLKPIGAEEGTFSYNGRAFTLDGIGNVLENGVATGNYYVYDDGRIFVVFDDDTIFSFNYQAANQASGVVTELQPQDKYIGIWYSEGTYSVIGEDGYRTDETVNDSKYYKMILDGFGVAKLFYHKDGKTYEQNWSDVVGTYYQTATGIHAQFNSAQPADIVFYYDMNVAYSASFGYLREKTFVKDGYTGPTTPPVLNANWTGRYTGQESDGTQVIFNIRVDCTGDYKGVPFVAVFDGNDTVRFTIGSVSYAVQFGSTVTISYGSESVTLTKGGSIVEVIPTAIAGTWTCSSVEGFGTGSGSYTFNIQSTGAITYNGSTILTNVVYTPSTFTITATGGGLAFIFIYNADEDTLYVEWSDDENRNWYGTFTHSSQD